MKLSDFLMIRISSKDLLKLFLGIAFPLHFWAILIFILNAPNPQTRSEWGEFFGIIAYILILALLESIFFFLAFVIGSYLLPKRWEEERVYKLLISVFYLFIFWAVIAQVGMVTPVPESKLTLWMAINLSNTVLYRQLAFVGVILVFSLIVLFQLYRLTKGRMPEHIVRFVERAIPLSYIYLFLDAVGFIYVLTRNL